MITYKFVPEHNGIELYFDDKPSICLCEELKDNGWRWHRTKKCWYTKRNPASEAFAKKQCGENPSQKHSVPPIVSPPPKLSGPAKEVSFRQLSDSVYVSTATITRNNQGYVIASTNNQIICCDCGKFFSVHANACPFCGCPMGHIAQHYLAKFDPEVLKEQERQRQMQLRQQRIAEQERKERIIKKLERKCKRWRPFYKLKSLDIEKFDTAVARIEFIEENENVLPDLSFDEWEEIITLSDEAYVRKIDELKVIKRDELDRAAVIQKADDVLRKINKIRVEALCKKHNISSETTAELIRWNVPYEEVQHRIDRIMYYIETYPALHFSLDEHVTLSEESMKEEVSFYIANGGSSAL